MRARHYVIGLSCIMQSLLLAGCDTTGMSRTEEDFGNSVRHMVKMQTYNPDAALLPSTEPQTEMDAERAGVVLETYRTEVGKPSEVAKPLVINVGQ
jgi:type IV pilus biogenesis protein CpaD/CtpE